MGYVIAAATLLVLLHPMLASADFLPPLFSPIFDDICKKVECRKGTCKPSTNATLFYECECDPGWKQTRSDKDDSLMFLPCIIPNCTMNYSCEQAAPSPVQDKSIKPNSSFFDPCSWTDCGGGSCNKISPFTHHCVCPQGYYNLLNITAFPCFKDCSLGMDCANLGIPVGNKTPSSSPALTERSNQGSSYLQANFNMLMILIILSLAVV